MFYLHVHAVAFASVIRDLVGIPVGVLCFLVCHLVLAGSWESRELWGGPCNEFKKPFKNTGERNHIVQE